jgi:hypothetical protein
VEAERISVDHVAHIKPSDGSSAATQCNFLSFLSQCTLQVANERTLLDCSAERIKLLVV